MTVKDVNTTYILRNTKTLKPPLLSLLSTLTVQHKNIIMSHSAARAKRRQDREDRHEESEEIVQINRAFSKCVRRGKTDINFQTHCKFRYISEGAERQTAECLLPLMCWTVSQIDMYIYQ
jgi:hypothetical protein